MSREMEINVVLCYKEATESGWISVSFELMQRIVGDVSSVRELSQRQLSAFLNEKFLVPTEAGFAVTPRLISKVGLAA